MNLDRIKIAGSTHRVNNELVADRLYHVAASARVNTLGELEGFDGGSVMTLPSMMPMATFNRSMGDTLHVDFTCAAEKQGEVLAAISGFIADLEEEGGEA